MKYLIDGVNKSVLSLANQYKHLRQDDEFKVFDDCFSNIEGLDLVQINNFYVDEDGNKVKVERSDNDSRLMKITTDFDSALEWCDCYVTFRSVPYEITIQSDLENAEKQVNALLSRIEQARSAGKKIYLGNRFSEEFSEIAGTYENCINPHITKENLEEIKDYSFFFKGTYPYFGFNTTMIVGTNSVSGKFSCALKAKKHYEDLGEKVILIHTEETYPFLDDQNGTVYGFCRNFSDLTTDEDFTYLQSLVAKIYNEQRPDRIIFVTQSGFGIDGVISSYQDSDNGYKMKGLWDVFITRSFGLDEVIVSANCNRLDLARRLVEYYNIKNSKVNASMIYVNPCIYDAGETIEYATDDKTKFYKAQQKCRFDELELQLKGFSLEHPEIDIQCDYCGITDKVREFKESEDFKYLCASSYVAKMLSGIKTILSSDIAEPVVEEIKTQAEEIHSEYGISDEDFNKIKEEGFSFSVSDKPHEESES